MGGLRKNNFLLLLLIWVPWEVLGRVVIYPEDPYFDILSRDDFVPQEEAYTNLTMDEVISQAYKNAAARNSGKNNSTGSHGEILAEMDMVMTPEQFEFYYGIKTDNSSTRKKRKAIRLESLRWTNGVIPYSFISKDFTAQHVYDIKAAMDEWSEVSCIKFRPAKDERNRIVFKDGGNGCSSQLGMLGGKQFVYLDKHGCRFKGLYLHEIGHAIGLVHEHQLPDRDKYIGINYANVLRGDNIWFKKYTVRDVNQFGVPYDFTSIMHYGVRAFSSNHGKTIIVKDLSKEHLIGRVYKKDLAFSDIKVVNLMYKCGQHCPADPNCKYPGFLDKHCKCKCPAGVNCTRDNGEAKISYADDVDCIDEYPKYKCRNWANKGFCGKRWEFMLIFCRKSCNQCAKDCTNKIQDFECEQSAWEGGCNRYPAWMMKHCRRSCGFCGSLSCVNKKSDRTCTSLGKKGDCEKDPKAMMVNCPKACGLCKPDCANRKSDAECDAWAAESKCWDNEKFMLYQCPKTCGACRNVTQPTTAPPTTTRAPPTTTKAPPKTTRVPTTTTKKPCANRSPDASCNMWKNWDHCRINPGFMLVMCEKACGVCRSEHEPTTTTTTKKPVATGKDCVNQMPDSDCEQWAGNGSCYVRSLYMLKNCAKSCGICEAECRNKASDKKCKDWAKGNGCRSGVDYMYVHCRKACGLCGG